MRRALAGCLGLLLCLSLSRCEMPTGAPDFSFESSLQAPLLLEKTFVLLGPQEGTDALIDTTRHGVDTLFRVESDNVLALVAEEELEDFVQLDELSRTLAERAMPAPVSVVAGVDDVLEQDLSAAYSFDLQVLRIEPLALVDTTMPVPVLPLEASLPSPPARLDLGTEFIDLQEGTEVVLGNATGGVNELHVSLYNGLDVPLTDSRAASPPRLRIRYADTGELLQEVVLERVPQPGETAAGMASLAGKRLVPELIYELDLGTYGGAAQPSGTIQLQVWTTTLEADRARAAVPGQTVQVERQRIAVAGESQLVGAVLASSQLALTLHNQLPIALQIESLQIRTREPVGGYPAGYTALQLGPVTVGPGETVTVPVQLGVVSREVDAVAMVSTPGSAMPVDVAAADRLEMELQGLARLNTLYFYPQGETFRTDGSISIQSDEVVFGPGDYVTLADGQLVLEDLLSTLDVNLDTLRLSFPDIRRPPYGPGDTLVIRFVRGAVDDPGRYLFSGISSGAAITRTLPLRDLRLYPAQNTLRYHIYGRLETASQARALEATDSVRATVRLENLDLKDARVQVSNLTADLNEDVNGDGLLDVALDAEARISSVDGLDELSKRVSGLQVQGTDLTLSLTTNIGGEATLYLAILGRAADGTTRFLRGRGAYAVTPDDPVIAPLRYNGSPLGADQLIRLPFVGTDDPDRPVTRTYVLDATNSNIDEFLSLLPQELRVVGRVVAEGAVQLRQPLTVTARAGLRIPLHIATDVIEVQDTVEVDLSSLDLPTDPQDDVQVEEARLTLRYANGIPLAVATEIELLDAFEQPIGVRIPAENTLQVAAAPVDGQGFATTYREGEVSVTLTRDQLALLKQGRRARLVLQVQTPAEQVSAVRIRASDALRLQLQGAFRYRTRVH
ncbi:hypothetical protein [Rhodothermus marinus]|uniref:hypothetical protein n=1 Tax=Rhodothermus marinus TaxID=29549 RepID=UPI0012BA55C3|nr:hypothetical protein [Rhodothermus marinus]BBM70189.1 hypothetical protein RmaAA213_20350 [Rhodothermus marinus]BBM73176.1 hypothetical protein RmaAA338_20410 [Rhodothermus marinus]